ncbi:unnamed protein product [Nezara viridula]|uniref:Uncharacterized protein n=1 Tax=Nezara viridula TaxID=85310 RepID=A0A9P0H7W3_NEZVI|nr:unnamed protein product [Nezara viridula]
MERRMLLVKSEDVSCWRRLDPHPREHEGVPIQSYLLKRLPQGEVAYGIYFSVSIISIYSMFFHMAGINIQLDFSLGVVDPRKSGGIQAGEKRVEKSGTRRTREALRDTARATIELSHSRSGICIPYCQLSSPQALVMNYVCHNGQSTSLFCGLFRLERIFRVHHAKLSMSEHDCSEFFIATTHLNNS